MNNVLKSTTWPVLPAVGQALIQTLNDDTASTDTICRIISKDPSLTATLLRMANSAIFGFSHSVDTLERAVSVVGTSLIRARALSICIAKVVSLPAGLDHQKFWRYSMLCAGYAQWIASRCGVNEQQAWLAGMMLRLGEINMLSDRPFVFVKLEGEPIAPGERWVRERVLLGFDEGQVTAQLLQHWDFPPVLVQAVRYAAQPQSAPESSPLAAVVHLAGRLADGGAVTQSSLEGLPLVVLILLNLNTDDLSVKLPDAASLLDISMFAH